MVKGMIISGNVQELRQDFKFLNKKLIHFTQYQMGKAIRKAAKAYVKHYNMLITKESGNSRLATAKIGPTYAYKSKKQSRVKTVIKIGQESIGYDEGKPKFIPINSRVKSWIKRNWKYDVKKRKWKATSRVSEMSKIYGKSNNPKGSLFVKSWKDRKGDGSTSINTMSQDYARGIMYDELTREMRMMRTSRADNRMLGIQNMYFLKIQLNI